MTDARTNSPARLFCLVVGAVLVGAGILGFFYSSAFTTDSADRDAVLGILDVNGFHNLVHIATGAITLAAANSFARQWTLIFGVVYLLVAVLGFIVGDGGMLLGIIPINTADNVLHLLLGGAGLAVYAATGADTRRTATA